MKTTIILVVGAILALTIRYLIFVGVAALLVWALGLAGTNIETSVWILGAIAMLINFIFNIK